MVGFIAGFIFLVRQFNSLGAAISIVLAYSISCIPALIWSEKVLLRYVINPVLAIAICWVCSYISRLILPLGIITEFTALLISFTVTSYLIFALKDTSIAEVRTILRVITKTTMLINNTVYRSLWYTNELLVFIILTYFINELLLEYYGPYRMPSVSKKELALYMRG
jgi:hypothetical protein